MSAVFIVVRDAPGAQEILRHGTCDAADFALQARAGERVIRSRAHPLTHRVVDGAVVEYDTATCAARAERPGPWHGWDVAALAWVDPRAPGEVLERQRQVVLGGLQREIEAQEARQGRATREALLALSQGTPVPEATLAVAQEIDRRVDVLRAAIRRAVAAGTVGELDAAALRVEVIE